MHGRPNISQDTLKALTRCAADPRRLGGETRAVRIAARHTGRHIKTFREMLVLFSSMLEEEALSLLAELRARMPDLTTDTVLETVRRMPKAA